jgi:hypothetical protein
MCLKLLLFLLFLTVEMGGLSCEWAGDSMLSSLTGFFFFFFVFLEALVSMDGDTDSADVTAGIWEDDGSVRSMSKSIHGATSVMSVGGLVAVVIVLVIDPCEIED